MVTIQLDDYRGKLETGGHLGGAQGVKGRGKGCAHVYSLCPVVVCRLLILWFWQQRYGNNLVDGPLARGPLHPTKCRNMA